MDKIPMTVEGEKLLREELSELKTIIRPQISEAIKEAREKGDLKENAEYHAAKEQQGFIAVSYTHLTLPTINSV